MLRTSSIWFFFYFDLFFIAILSHFWWHLIFSQRFFTVVWLIPGIFFLFIVIVWIKNLRRTSSMWFFFNFDLFFIEFWFFWYLDNVFFSSLVEPGIFLFFIVIVWIKNIHRISLWFIFDVYFSLQFWCLLIFDNDFFSSLAEPGIFFFFIVLCEAKICTELRRCNFFSIIWQRFF